MRTAPRRLLAVALLIFAVPAVSAAQAPAVATTATEASARRGLTLDDYGAWKRINSTGLSPDGRWLSYGYNPNEGDDTLFVKLLDGDRVYTVPVGAQPTFSADSRWAAYMVSPAEAEAEKLREQRKPVPRALQLRNLETGETHDVPDVSPAAH